MYTFQKNIINRIVVMVLKGSREISARLVDLAGSRHDESASC